MRRNLNVLVLLSCMGLGSTTSSYTMPEPIAYKPQTFTEEPEKVRESRQQRRARERKSKK